MLLPEILQLTQLAPDLLLHVERLLALSLPPLVASNNQLADLLAESAVGTQPRTAGIGGQQPLDLRIDVDRLTALRYRTIRPGLDHLPDLLLADLGRDRMDRPLRARREVLVESEIALPDLLQGVAG